MTLPVAADREASHHRVVDYRSYRRTDGLWDIEGTVRDTKSYNYYDLERGTLAPGEYVHDISMRITIDDEMTVVDIAASMDIVPFSFCQGGANGLPALIGGNLGRGWRKRLEASLGKTLGCAHLREMLFGAATVAFQTLSAERERRVGTVDLDPGNLSEKPFYLGGCYSLAEGSEVVQTFYPQFFEHASSGKE